MKKVIFDPNALIASFKYALNKKRICEYLVDYVEIHIPEALHHELEAHPEKFPSHAVLQRLISQNKIIVDAVDPKAETARWLDGAKLSPGKQDAILLYLQNQSRYDAIIVDDIFATMICYSFRIGSLLLLDLLVRLGRERIMPHELAAAIIVKITPQYRQGFGVHSLEMLNEANSSELPPVI